MSKDVKELNEDGVFYQPSSPKPISVRSRKVPGIKYVTPVLRKLDNTITPMEKAVKIDKGFTVSQTRNSNTGHWIKRNEISGELIIGNGTRPFAGVVVRRKFRAAPNPSISKETAEMAEKAVLAILNRSLTK
ncbi:hypothetical protein [Dyadobacter frigoris]|uniref:Uncharacterized protein n=1 Tax=Dyadobacter frigoris TaxID=2576211 RepID=A0A4U6D837_9BACT|nr:hypothetical protein [Dyadobacter frigoris]TKT90294.1 hypothetical protein FDK13_21385 [Dyadobacter frigoris]GLU52529.1 hypothetical protein Dfri01_19900 [Dyadobacter frigoris]